MPTYVYRREDGSTFEIQQRITEDALETCPETGQKVKRVITGSTGLIFKGDGFYITDYARKENGNPNAARDARSDDNAPANGSSESTASDTGTPNTTASESSSPSTNAA